MTLERYSHVMHLTSQVAGDLAEGMGPIDVLRATFPAGTVSGAPKVRAMEIIDELEPTKRGPYAGVVGYVDFSGNLDTAIAIRTMFWRDGQATLQAGRGDRRRFGARGRRPGMPEQGAGVAHCSGRRTTTPRRVMTVPFQARVARDLVVVDGPDATSFLQSLVSQDLDAVAVGATRPLAAAATAGQAARRLLRACTSSPTRGGACARAASASARERAQPVQDPGEGRRPRGRRRRARRSRGEQPPARSGRRSGRRRRLAAERRRSTRSVRRRRSRRFGAAIDVPGRRRRRVRAGAHRGRRAAAGLRHRRAHHSRKRPGSNWSRCRSRRAASSARSSCAGSTRAVT